jgi:hypothetical protein
VVVWKLVEEEGAAFPLVVMRPTVPAPEPALDLLNTVMICRRFSMFLRSSS